MKLSSGHRRSSYVCLFSRQKSWDAALSSLVGLYNTPHQQARCPCVTPALTVVVPLSRCPAVTWTSRPRAEPEEAPLRGQGAFPDAFFCFRNPAYYPVPESSAVHAKAGTQGFPAERSRFTRRSLLFPPLLAGFNVVAVDFHFNLVEKNCSDSQSEPDVNLN